ncbi:TetR/AcrR family transcriptional regulator [Nitratireductor indicus]|uniref:TetR family transcriptional regulator n=1 Tax=Nitratireductor indicus C115 TaxID=1231190 RepID=K2PJ58_9HYPH|nr:TetR/AcrR family transcriptional regulator [Nitratireductor indicus]EKF41177.1 TetR family transcriptional regulator [Nitratireductor indicus C115]MDS1138244.1 TetR/AcrR family transcriptional regulator [Nitratireductor indicus]SFQ64493.1 transcriptional regulator, TetR family [Nitratireductor indicus]
METVRLDEAMPAARRNPSQKRSRERVERILAVATEIIAASGSEQMKMSEVAQKAGISIGSLYQYFPDKAAIIRTLAEHYNAQGRECICEALDAVSTPEELAQAFTGLVETYYAMFLAEPVMRDIWSGTQADKALNALDFEDVCANGATLAAAISRVTSGRDAQEIADSSLLIMHLGEATMRLAIQTDEEGGRRLVNRFTAMALREMLDR